MHTTRTWSTHKNIGYTNEIDVSQITDDHSSNTSQPASVIKGITAGQTVNNGLTAVLDIN